jgi:hypothetical protein
MFEQVSQFEIGHGLGQGSQTLQLVAGVEQLQCGWPLPRQDFDCLCAEQPAAQFCGEGQAQSGE